MVRNRRPRTNKDDDCKDDFRMILEGFEGNLREMNETNVKSSLLGGAAAGDGQSLGALVVPRHLRRRAVAPQRHLEPPQGHHGGLPVLKTSKG